MKNAKAFGLGGTLAAALLLGAIAGPSSAAQETEIYQWRGDDGVTVLSNKPPPKRVTDYSVRKVNPDDITTIPMPEAPADAGARPVLPARVAAANEAITRAERALSAAEAAQAAGREPLPGERRGTVHGTSRLTEPYFERQKQLADDVQQARDRLTQARRARAALAVE